MTSLKHKLQNKELTVGSWITLAHPDIAEIMARAGFDWLAIDLEHSVITISEAGELIRIIDLCGVVPLVRLSANDPVQIKRVMDAGAHGVIVPMVNSTGDAENAVRSIRYPNKGNRGIGLARAQGYGAAFKQYLEWVNRETVVIAQVEHIEAVNNLESILSVEGIDGYIVGPYDLSGSLGIPGRFDDAKMQEAMEKIRVLGSASNKATGIHVVEPDTDQLRKAVENGHSFIAYSVDIRMLDCMCRKGLKAVNLF